MIKVFAYIRLPHSLRSLGHLCSVLTIAMR
nr:MAG TPA: hypothetical protein [Microviridae sp.]